MDRYGDYHVGRTIKADRRINTGATAETLTSARSLVLNDYQWLRASCSTEQDVILPDAETLPLGWNIVVDVPEGSTAGVTVKTFHGVTPVAIKPIITGRAYKFTCVDNTTPEGTWYINFLEEADLIPTERYIKTFDATTDWGSSSNGYYIITVTQGTHGRGQHPQVSVRKKDSSDYLAVEPDEIKILSTGNVQIKVPSNTPDLRFEGQILFI